jgi:hypothetical protein
MTKEIQNPKPKAISLYSLLLNLHDVFVCFKKKLMLRIIKKTVLVYSVHCFHKLPFS